MTRFSKYKLCIALLLGLSLSSCDNGFEEINTNPNEPEDVPASVILPAAQQSAVSRLLGASVNLTYASTWAQHIAKIQYIDEDRYNFRASDFSIHWDQIYSGPLLDTRLVIEKAEASGNSSMEGVARTWRTWIFHNITDLWGDVPYSEALQGVEGNLTPTYDSQESIYMDMLQQLESANTLIAEGSGSVAGDLIYNGNAAQWRKFANSLRLRLLIHIARVAPDRAKEGIERIMGNPDIYPIFESNADNAQLTYLVAQPYRNPWFENSVTRDDHAISETMVEILDERNDPRITVYAHPAENPIEEAGVKFGGNTYVGQPNGAVAQPSLPTVSRIGAKYRDNPTQPLYIMTYAEVMFILAEAAERGWDVGMSAAEAYEAGVRASLALNGLAGEADTYLAQPSVDYEAQDNKLEAISTQKWIALFGNGIEAFTEYRRMGYPNNIEEVPASFFPGRGVPLRFSYTDQERSTNRANVEAASGGIVDFLFGERLWWDVD